MIYAVCPCPFCGSKRLTLQRTGGVSNVLCRDCGAQGPNGYTFAHHRDVPPQDLDAAIQWNIGVNNNNPQWLINEQNYREPLHVELD